MNTVHHRHTDGRDRLAAAGTDTTYRLTRAGHRQLTDFALDIAAVLRHRRPSATAWIGLNSATTLPERSATR